jgi:hypothetical protein
VKMVWINFGVLRVTQKVKEPGVVVNVDRTDVVKMKSHAAAPAL